MTVTATIDKSIPFLTVTVREDAGYVATHYGTCFTQPDPLPDYDCGPYTLTVSRDGVVIGTVTYDHHQWRTERWFDLKTVTPADIKRTPAQLVALDMVPPMAVLADLGMAPFNPGQITFSGYQGSDETPFEGTTGGRPAIGEESGVEGEFLATGDSRDMLTDALAAPFQPIWLYDEATGKLIDPIAKPYANSYGPAQSDWIPPGNTISVSAAAGPNDELDPWQLDDAHMVDLCGLAGMAFGAPRFVLGAQARVIEAFTQDGYNVTTFGGMTVWGRQMRGTAWLLDRLFSAYCATLLAEQDGTLPPEANPSATLRQLLDNQASQFHRLIEPSEVYQKLQVCGTNNNQIAWWQCDMLNGVLGKLARKMPETWGPIWLRTLNNLMSRLDPTKWKPAFCTWYWVQATDSSGAIYKDYPTFWNAFVSLQLAGAEPSGNNGQINAAQVALLNADPFNGDTFIGPSEYQDWAYAALAQAVYNDRSGPMKGQVRAMYPGIELSFSRYCIAMKKFGYIIPQCAIAVDPLPVSDTPANPQEPPMTDALDPLKAAVAQVASDAAAVVAAASAEVKAIHDRIVAIIAAATGNGTQVDPTELQAQVDALNSAHQNLANAASQLTADTAALPNATA